MEAAKAALLQWSAIKDLTFNPSRGSVEWQIGVMPDGSDRYGLAESVCLELRERGLSDADTDVRIVDLLKAMQTNGDFRAASLGHVICATGDRLEV